MLSLLDWLRRLDARLLSVGTSAQPATSAGAAVPVLAAVIGALAVACAAVLLQTHVLLQLVVVCAGLVLTVPYLQDRFDRVRAAARE